MSVDSKDQEKKRRTQQIHPVLDSLFNGKTCSSIKFKGVLSGLVVVKHFDRLTVTTFEAVGQRTVGNR